MSNQHGWLSRYEEIRDTKFHKVIRTQKTVRPERHTPEITLEMLGYMIIINFSNDELKQELDKLENKDEALAQYLKSRNIDLDEIRDDIGHKF